MKLKSSRASFLPNFRILKLLLLHQGLSLLDKNGTDLVYILAELGGYHAQLGGTTDGGRRLEAAAEVIFAQRLPDEALAAGRYRPIKLSV